MVLHHPKYNQHKVTTITHMRRMEGGKEQGREGGRERERKRGGERERWGEREQAGR